MFALITASLGEEDAPRISVFPDPDWLEESPESQGVNPEKLQAAVAYMEENFGPEGARELVLIRYGYLIWQGPACDAFHSLYSATKVFTSTVLGLLVQDGKCAPDDLAIRYLPDLDDQYPGYARIKLRHLASMSGGYQGQVEKVTPEQPWGDPLAYLSPAAPYFESGTHYQYNDHDVFLLGHILTRVAGESEQSLFQRRIADPLGMAPWEWPVCGVVEGLELNNAAGTPGPAPWGAGIRTTARQLARLGLLYLRRGHWKGRQLLSASFVDEATRNQLPLSLGFRNWDRRGAYGWYWWTNGEMANGRRPWPAAPPRTYGAHGHNANFCFVVPEWDMVVVRMGTIPIREQIASGDQLWDTFFGKLAEALTVPSS